MNFDTIWSEYKDWIETNIGKNYIQQFNPPISPKEIEHIESKLGLEFPVDLRSFLLTYDGIDDLRFILGADELLSGQKIYQYWLNGYNLLSEEIKHVGSPISNSSQLDSYNKEHNQDYFEEYDKGIKWLPFSEKWVPFMSDNGGTTIWYIDLDPDDLGKMGQIIEYYPEGGEAKIVSWSYLEIFLENLDKLKRDDYVFDSYVGLVQSHKLAKVEEQIDRNKKIEASISSNIKFEEIQKMKNGDVFTIIGVITSKNHFMEEIKIFRDSLKKTAFIERTKLKAKELLAPRLSKRQCFLLIGEQYLILNKPVNDEMLDFSDQRAVNVSIKVLGKDKYELLKYEILG